ncbi:MAG: hypothetical protein RL172_2257 [Bacteroidota bacterium]|jgi:hypothetical protein
MEKKSYYVTESGIDYDGHSYNENQKFEYELAADSTPVGYAKSVSPNAAKQMITDCITELVIDAIAQLPSTATLEEKIAIISTKLSDENIAIEFGKEALLLILAQEDCVGIRFAFCKNRTAEKSVVAMGIKIETINNQPMSVPIKKDAFNKNDSFCKHNPIIKEEGIGKKPIQILQETGLSLDTVVADAIDNQKMIENISDTFTKGFFGLL